MFGKCTLTVLALSSLALIAPDARGQGIQMHYLKLTHQVALTPRASEIFLALSAAEGIHVFDTIKLLLGVPGTPINGYEAGIARLRWDIWMLLRFRGGEPRLIASILGDLPTGMVARIEAMALSGTEELSVALLDAKDWLNDEHRLGRYLDLDSYLAARSSSLASAWFGNEELAAMRRSDVALVLKFFDGDTQALRALSPVAYEALRDALNLPSRTENPVVMSALPTMADLKAGLSRRLEPSAQAVYIGSVLALIERTLRPFTATGTDLIDMQHPEWFLPDPDLRVDLDVYARLIEITRFTGFALSVEPNRFSDVDTGLRIKVSDRALLGNPHNLIDEYSEMLLRYSAIEIFLENCAERSGDPAFIEIFNRMNDLDIR